MQTALSKFVRRLFIFLLPLIVFYILVYAFAVLYPSIFKVKADYIKSNKEEVEILFLGSSHAHHAVNPRLIEADGKVMNLAYNGQTMKLNKMLLDKFYPDMKNLKYLVIELDYFSLEHFTGNEEYRQPLYQTFYGIASGEGEWWTKYFFTRDDLIFFSRGAAHNLWSYFKNPNYSINEWGFIENNVNYQFAQMNYDEEEICRTLPQRIEGSHPLQSIQNYRVNASLTDSIIQFCEDNKIQPILVAYPVFNSYYELEIPAKKARHFYYIQQAKKRFPNLIFWNFEQDERFTVRDFWDDDHLDITGANKLSAIVNERLKEIRASH